MQFKPAKTHETNSKAATNSFFKNNQESPKPFFKPIIQPKLTVNKPNDVYEQEADKVADHVVEMSDPPVLNTPSPLPLIHRTPSNDEEEGQDLQREELNEEGPLKQGKTGGNFIGVNSAGTNLPEDVRGFYEPRFGYDFSNVRVHTDTAAARSAQSINAEAYTTGHNIVFNEGRYAPGTETGKRLIAHELTHVVQQNKSTGSIIQRQPAEVAPSPGTPAQPATEFHPQVEQWQNTTLAPVIYPFRERMYHRLLDLFRSGGDTPSLGGENLYQAVRDTLATSGIPAWVQQTFLDHAGMRYRSAHGSSLPPWLLVDILDELRNPGTSRQRGRRMTPRGRSNAQILGELRQQHSAGEIPEDAWLYIVRKTDLRLETTDRGWESANYTNVADPVWRQALQRWTRTGTTMWRGELMRNNAIQTTSIVCNELAEVAQRHRGIRLPGGIAANSDFFYNQANASQPGSETTQPAPYFKHGPTITPQDLRPGASVFFLSNEWKNSPAEPHERVRVYPGVQFPVPWPPSISPRDRRRRTQAAAEGPLLPGTGVRPIITEGYVDEDGWTYHIGTQITRTRHLGEDMQGPEQTQWMKWSHQATVVGQNRRGIILLETTLIGAGFNTRSLSSLRSQFVFVAWLPEREGGTTTVAIPATGTATPATPTSGAAPQP